MLTLFYQCHNVESKFEEKIFSDSQQTWQKYPSRMTVDRKRIIREIAH